MDWDALGAGAADLGGGLIGGAISGHMQRTNMREQNRFNYQMSSTAYQRAAADMALAGLNPILGLPRGGSQVPSATASGGANFGSRPGTAATAKAAQKAQANLLHNQTIHEKDKRTETRARTMAHRAQAGKSAADMQTAFETAENLRSSRRLIDAQVVGEEMMADLYESAAGEAIKLLSTSQIGGLAGVLVRALAQGRGRRRSSSSASRGLNKSQTKPKYLPPRVHRGSELSDFLDREFKKDPGNFSKDRRRPR